MDAEQKKCPGCGAALEDGMTTCPGCGQPVSEAEESAPSSEEGM